MRLRDGPEVLRPPSTRASLDRNEYSRGWWYYIDSPCTPSVTMIYICNWSRPDPTYVSPPSAHIQPLVSRFGEVSYLPYRIWIDSQIMCICIVFSDEGISVKLTIKVGSRRKGKRIGKYRIKWLIIPTTKIVPKTFEKELRLYCFLRRQLLHWWFGRLIGLIWLTCCIRMSSLQRRPRGFFSGLPRVRKMEFLMSLECITDTSVKLST